MASLNKVMIIGNLGRDPEVRYTPSGDAVANISLATTSSWKDKATNEKKEATEWHRVVFYGRLAEIVGEYAKKGRPLYVEGRLQTRKWTNKEGQEQYTTEIIAEQMQLLGSREGSGDADARMDGGYSRESGGNSGGGGGNSYGGGTVQARPAPTRKPGPPPEMDDDIPF